VIAKEYANTFVAGGQALDSNMQRMMEVVPQHIHDRSGIFMGSYDEIEKVKSFHK
jgi:fructose-1,6-bisphosphatase I